MESINNVNFEYVKQLTNIFYEFMGNTYIEHKKLQKKIIESTIENNIQLISDIHITDTEPVVTEPINKHQTFSEYFLFKLYYNYGIKRQIVNNHIALLYYSKTSKGYKPNEPITILCRHMLLDTNNMRIISLGIPKSINIDDFCNTYEIDKTKFETNSSNVELDVRKLKTRVYKFSEGTMLTYNPSLKKYNITEPLDFNYDADATTLEATTLEKTIATSFNHQFIYCTRKVIGTGRFNGSKTFLEMFDENNSIANTNLYNIPEPIMKDKVLVFNIEHPDNKIISKEVRNYNTLCAVFQFKDEESSQQAYDKIVKIVNIEDGIESSNETVSKLILEAFHSLGNNMITQIQVSVFKKQVCEYNVNLHLPEVIKSFEKINEKGDTVITKIEDVSIEQLQAIVSNKPKEFQGYIIYGLNGERTKLINSKYKDLRHLKGNKPINIAEDNIKNLFFLYWRLVKENKVNDFIREFDNTNEYTTGFDRVYTRIFNWFLSITRCYALNLFNVYHDSFVKRTMQKTEIRYSMKPLCGDLHKLYIANKLPITKKMVEEYIFEQPDTKMFWRLFLDNKE